MKSIGVIYALNGHPIQRDLADRMAVVLRGRGNLLRHAHHPSVMLLQALWKEQVPDVWAEASPSTHLAGDVRLYYHQDLCQRLEVGGVWQRAPLSDLDLIAQAYARWGTRCVDYLEGDYCFVLWDERQHQLFAARSPFGLRPLLYARTPTALLLASDTELLRAAAPQIPLTLDPEWLAVFLVKDRHRRGTMFLSIEEVPPGSSLVFREDGSCTQTTFWPPTVLPPLLSYRDQRDYTIQFRTLLREAVGERIADASVRPILCDVSGGLDSSTIACLAAQQWTAPFPLYGIHFSSVRYQEKDDRSFAQAVAKAYPKPAEGLAGCSPRSGISLTNLRSRSANASSDCVRTPSIGSSIV